MPMLKLALIGGACACLCVSYASWLAGFPPEIALTRGVVAFMAVSFIGFFGELVSAHARPAGPPEQLPPGEPESSV